jgi:hypothetical protein
MNHRIAFRLATFLILLLAIAFQVSAQEATIVGTVTDPTGATVPNANVKITNTDTGLMRQFASNMAGEYVAPSLQIGRYVVRAEAAGFKSVEHKDLVLQVGDRIRVDFKLEIGAATEQITVEATPVAVQSDSSEVSHMINGDQVNQIATNGRNIYLLTTLLPGVSNAMDNDFQLQLPVSANAAVSFEGQRVGHNLFMIDGAEAYDRGGEGRLSVMPSLESIAEFRALSSNYSPEFGLSSAGTTTLVLKSGTQTIHAAAWEFVRNDWLGASNFFTNAAGQQKPELRFNEFGFNVGGPVTFGKLYNKNRNKTFFFYNMEWRKYVQGGSPINTTVPLTQWYTGNMSGGPTIHVPTADQLAPSIMSKFTALGLQPGQAFPNNTIPTTLLDPNTQALLKAGIFPAPTSGTQFVKGVAAPTNLKDETTRIDHHFSDRVTVFGHLIAEQIQQGYVQTMWSGDNVPTIGNTFGNPTYSAVARMIATISPSVVNEAAFNFNGNRISIVPTGVYALPSGYSGTRLFTGPNNLNRIPQIQLQGSTGSNFQTQAWPWHNAANSYSWSDDLSWSKGSHQFKFGASLLWYTKVQDTFGNTNGDFHFRGTYTGNDFADFLLGYATSYTEQGVQDAGYWNSKSFGLYAQDNWRVTKRLTVNLGLRWDGIPHTYELNDRMSNFYPNLYDPSKRPVYLADGTISPSSPGLITSPNPILKGVQFYGNGVGIAGKNGIPNGLVNNYWTNFGPRVGFAYDLTGNSKTILRGGFGIMYERIQGNDVYNAAGDIPFSATVNTQGVSISSPGVLLSTAEKVVNPILPQSIVGLSQTNYKSPTSYQYSIGIQRSLGEKTVVSAGYVGNQNRHQSYRDETNLPPQSVLAGLVKNTVQFNSVVPYAGFGSINLYENAANSHYNSLQLSANSRLHKDLSFQLAYTYSKAMDSAAGTGSGGDLQSLANPYDRSYGWGPAYFNRNHVFTANFIYDIPAFRHASSQAVRTVAGGWQFAGYITAESGLPVNVYLGTSAAYNGLPNYQGNGPGGNRPNVNGPITYTTSPTACGGGKSSDPCWFNTSVFSAPTVGQWGNLSFDALHGPGRHNWNVSLFKNFTLSEKRGSGFELRAEAFNIFNHTQFQGSNFSGIANTSDASNFGHITAAFDPRVFQLGLKAHF